MRTYYGNKKKQHTSMGTINRNFVSQHYIKLEDNKGYECKYCPYVFRLRNVEMLMLHLIQKHQVGTAAINVGGRA